jgi:phosphotransferase system enzyme I (PtsI)
MASPQVLTGEVVLHGQGLSPGLVQGPAFVYRDILERDLARYCVVASLVEDEMSRIRHAVEVVSGELKLSAARIDDHLNPKLGDIFRAHEVLLRDPALESEFRRELAAQRVNAEVVVRDVMARWELKLRSLNGDERSDDLSDLSRRLLRELLGEESDLLSNCPPGSILVAHRLLPSETVYFKRGTIAGAALEVGATASHAALLTREMGLPAVTQLPTLLAEVADEDWLLVDGFSGTIVVRPNDETRQAFAARIEQWRASALTARNHCQERAVTRDGTQIDVMANITGRADATTAKQSGADGIGLYRIGHIYRSSRVLPSEQQLLEGLRNTLQPVAGMQVTVRFLDTGGDKPLPYVDVPPEPNPFLGRRGVRFLLAYPELMQSQCRALLRLSQEFNVRLLVPMVTLADDMQRVRAHLERAARDIGADKLPPIGAMIETPAAALCIREIGKYIDFLAIGTNDLTQYTMACGRENALVTNYFIDHHPAVLRLIRIVQEESDGKPVSVCGELAARLATLPELLSLGIRTLSVAPPLVPAVKEAVRGVTLASDDV